MYEIGFLLVKNQEFHDDSLFSINLEVKAVLMVEMETSHFYEFLLLFKHLNRHSNSIVYVFIPGLASSNHYFSKSNCCYVIRVQ